MNDNVNHPSHYTEQCSIECIDAMELALGSAGMLCFCLGNAFKYLWRHKGKNGLEDLHKARWYLSHAEKYLADADAHQEDMMFTLSELLERAEEDAIDKEGADI